MGNNNLFKDYQGETIIVDVASEEGDLDAVDFALLFYRYTNMPYTVSKEEMMSPEIGKYRAMVPASETSGWTTGEYTVELVIERDGEQVSIAKKLCFVIDLSASKGKL